MGATLPDPQPHHSPHSNGPHGIAGIAAVAELQPDRAVFAVDPQRRITFWSTGAERMLGYRAAEADDGERLQFRDHQRIRGRDQCVDDKRIL